MSSITVKFIKIEKSIVGGVFCLDQIGGVFTAALSYGQSCLLGLCYGQEPIKLLKEHKKSVKGNSRHHKHVNEAII